MQQEALTKRGDAATHKEATERTGQDRTLPDVWCVKITTVESQAGTNHIHRVKVLLA